MSDDPKKPLGRILLRQDAVTQPELDRALERATPDGPPLASRMIASGSLSELAALKALSEQNGVPGIDLNQICIRLKDLDIVPREVAVRHKLLPVLVRDDRVFVAMAAPSEKKVIDEIEFVSGKRVFPYVALAGPLMRVIARAYEMRERGDPFYIGPECPPDVQRKAGVTAPSDVAPPATGSTGATHAAAPARSGGGPPPLPPPSAPQPQAQSNDAGFRPTQATPGRPRADSVVVVDDAMGRMAAADELNDADFGDVDRELSVMAELPKDPKDAKDGRRTVLVVDDEADIRKMVRRVLEDRGFRVVEASRGHEALAMLKERPPDLVVLDAMLPEIHGFDIAKRIKGSERYAHIPIVMISAVYKGWRFAEDVRQSYGVDAYIEKPFKVADLVAAVEAAILQRPEPSDVEKISAEAERRLSAGIEAYQRGDHAAAVEHLREGTRIDPLAYRLHFHLGLLYGKQGQVYDAIQALQTALDINRKHFPALKNLAVLYQKAGFRNKAIETWERALRVAPDDPTRQSIKEHLVGLL
jgi:DNA-binding response OmpR family regulator